MDKFIGKYPYFEHKRVRCMKGARPLLFLLLLSLILIPPFIHFGPINTQPKPQETLPIETDFNKQSSRTEQTPQRIPMANDSAPRNWTVLVYMAADNDQQNAAFENINEMEMVGSTRQVNIIVYVDFLSNSTQFDSGAYTFNITKDTPINNNSINSEPLNTTLPTEPNMGDPSTLLAFIQFGQNYSQADHYLLILWDKGSGYTGVCIDDTSGGDRLLPHEIALVLENSSIQPIDITAFDASYMGQLELANEIRDGTDYIIFSEEIIPVQHFPYHVFLNSLIMHEDSSPFLLAKEIVDRYVEAYSPLGDYYSQSGPTNLGLAIVNASQVSNVFVRFFQTINWLNTSYNTLHFYSQISTARGFAQQFSIPYYIDLGALSQQLAIWVPNPTFRNFAGNLSLSIQTAISYHQHLSGIPSATGLGINFDYYEPIPLSLLDDTAYEDFLAYFLTLGETESNALVTLSFGPKAGYLEGKGDSVYYQFSTSIGAQHTISITAYQDVDEDFDLYLYDNNLNILTRSVGLSSDEVIQWALIPGQLYYIRVYSSPRSDITYGLGSFEFLITPSSTINPADLVLQVGIIISVVFIIIFIIYLIWRNWDRIKRAVERYRIKRMAQRLQSEAVLEPDIQPTATACVKCGELMPEDARFCPNCREPSEDSTDEAKD